MQTTAPGVETIVAPPPLLPPTSGLLQVARVIEHRVDDEGPFAERDHWLSGIRWPVPNNQGLVAIDACHTNLVLPEDNSGLPAGAYYPFAVVEEDSCYAATFGEETFRARAEEGLLAREPAAVEAQLERGLVGPTVNPHLADTEAGVIYLASTGASQATQLALTPKDALAVLDEAIAVWGGGLGMIHAPAYVIAQWVSSRSVLIEDLTDTTIPRDPRRVFFSPNGNIIVAGSGYRGVSPDGTVVPNSTVSGHAAMWCYATDLIVVHREDRVSFIPDNMAQALNRQTNLVTWRAWRAYAFAWNRLLHASVKVNTPLAAAP